MKLPSKEDLLFFKSLTVMAHPLSDRENNSVARAKYFNLCSIILVNVLSMIGTNIAFSFRQNGDWGYQQSPSAHLLQRY